VLFYTGTVHYRFCGLTEIFEGKEGREESRGIVRYARDMSTGSGSSRGSRHGGSRYPSQVAANALSNSPRINRVTTMPPQQTPTPTQAPVSVSPLIGSPNSMGSGINPTSSLLVSQLLVGSASSVVDPGAAATPFGMIVVGDGTVQNEIVKKKNEDAAATRDSITELEETHDLGDISEMVEGGGMAFPTVPGYEDLRPVYSIVGFSPAFCDVFCPRT